jgi:hypothetical protein
VFFVRALGIYMPFIHSSAKEKKKSKCNGFVAIVVKRGVQKKANPPLSQRQGLLKKIATKNP